MNAAASGHLPSHDTRSAEQVVRNLTRGLAPHSAQRAEGKENKRQVHWKTWCKAQEMKAFFEKKKGNASEATVSARVGPSADTTRREPPEAQCRHAPLAAEAASAAMNQMIREEDLADELDEMQRLLESVEEQEMAARESGFEFELFS